MKIKQGCRSRTRKVNKPELLFDVDYISFMGCDYPYPKEYKVKNCAHCRKLILDSCNHPHGWIPSLIRERDKADIEVAKHEEVEEWRDIRGYKRIAQISSWGNVRKIKDPLNHKKIKVQVHHTNGYMYFNLPSRRKGEKNNKAQLSRTVARAFIDNPHRKPEVNHKDCNPKNNFVGNLEWVTRIENIDHKRKRGVIKDTKHHQHNRSKYDSTYEEPDSLFDVMTRLNKGAK